MTSTLPLGIPGYIASLLQ